MATHHSHSLLPDRPTWAPRTVLVYPAERTISWKALFVLATLLLAAAIVFTVYLLVQPLPFLRNT
jgi:hypothetical protein